MALRPATNIMLQSYLGVLAIAELLIIGRLWRGEPLSKVIPVFTGDKDAAFRQLACFLAMMLMCVRVSAAMTPVSVAAWRTVAATHVAEAAYIVAVAFGVGEPRGAHALPVALAEWSVAHTGTAIFVAIVIANAGLFTGVALVVRGAELRFKQRELARHRAAAADARERANDSARGKDSALGAAAAEPASRGLRPMKSD
jgi:hypothetical protein